jgi:hypothetical protein
MNSGAVATVNVLPEEKIRSDRLFRTEFETICPAIQDRETALSEFQSDINHNVLYKLVVSSKLKLQLQM